MTYSCVSLIETKTFVVASLTTTEQELERRSLHLSSLLHFIDTTIRMQRRAAVVVASPRGRRKQVSAFFTDCLSCFIAQWPLITPYVRLLFRVLSPSTTSPYVSSWHGSVQYRFSPPFD